ncbi:NAD regulator [Phyllobacterium sp. SB3]|uniref:NUDIX hydrolase n=1 Tax=Phyllobacterium sp. SB3 TaxID=3156073 RepID=UPI0032AFD8E5
MTTALNAVEINLSAAIAAVANNDPLILTTLSSGELERDELPFGPFNPLEHRTFETGLREWVAEQTPLQLGYVEQLYTFGDRGRHKTVEDRGLHVVSVGYLALTRITENSSEQLRKSGARWRSWYSFLPWEDWRGGKPAMIDEEIRPALLEWAQANALPSRIGRFRMAFGDENIAWDEERVLERYELLYEAGLIEEAIRDGRADRPSSRCLPGLAMSFDHRRILATAISRLRAKLKYRPVVFELMPPTFTLTALQETVEAISGRHLHKQNFRRLVETTELVEPTGAEQIQARGRPAALYRFRHNVLEERSVAGLRVGNRS